MTSHVLQNMRELNMTNLIVNKANHGYSVIAVAINDTDANVMCFEPVYDEPVTHTVSKEELINEVREWNLGTIYKHDDGSLFRLVHSKYLDNTHDAYRGGATLLIAKEHDHPVVYDMGCYKYPNVKQSDYRYCKYKSSRPVFKIHFHSDDESLLEAGRVYYHNKNEDTIILTKDKDLMLVDSSEPGLLPVVNQDFNNQFGFEIQYNDSQSVANGTVNLINVNGTTQTHIDVRDGHFALDPQYIVGHHLTADVLYGYNFIGHIDVNIE